MCVCVRVRARACVSSVCVGCKEQAGACSGQGAQGEGKGRAAPKDTEAGEAQMNQHSFFRLLVRQVTVQPSFITFQAHGELLFFDF